MLTAIIKPDRSKGEIYTTKGMLNLLNFYKQNLKDETYLLLAREILKRIEELSQFLANQYPDPEERFKVEAQYIDEIIRLQISKSSQISCGKGCAACCHMEVFISDEEAMVLSRLIKEGLSIDNDRFHEQASRSCGDEKWFGPPRHENRCVFLGDDNTCRIYDKRPLSCRKLFVTSPKENCADPKKQVITNYIRDAEILASGAFNVSRSVGPLAKKILERLNSNDV